jgi:hypothetical protein
MRMIPEKNRVGDYFEGIPVRDKQVLILNQQGWTNKQIANQFVKLKMIILLLFSLMARNQICNSQSKTSELPVIDISKTYPKKTIILQDVADIEYVRLETSDDVLMSFRSMDDYSAIASITDKYIITYEKKRGDIFVFDRKGKILNHFNRRGSSGQEYTQIMGGVLFDEKKEEIFVVATYSIKVYTLSGNFKRSFIMGGHFDNIEVSIFDDETLLVYNKVYVDYRNDGSTSNKKPYKLISKEDNPIVRIVKFK